MREECSSCLTSITVPSLNCHLTMSVSSEVPLEYSALSRADQNLLKSWSLMKCQTWERGAGQSHVSHCVLRQCNHVCDNTPLMTADSVTEVEVGIAPDMLKVIRFGIEFVFE